MRKKIFFLQWRLLYRREDGGVAILDKRELRLHITRLPVMLATTFYARPNDWESSCTSYWLKGAHTRTQIFKRRKTCLEICSSGCCCLFSSSNQSSWTKSVFDSKCTTTIGRNSRTNLSIEQVWKKFGSACILRYKVFFSSFLVIIYNGKIVVCGRACMDR